MTKTLDDVYKEFGTDNNGESGLFIELDGKPVTVGRVYGRTENGETKVVLVPAKVRVRNRNNNKEATHAQGKATQNDS